MKLHLECLETVLSSKHHVTRFVTRIALSVCILSFTSCSDEDSDEDAGDDVGSFTERTVSVEAGSMPVAGTIAAQYADYVSGASLENVADGHERTAYSTSHKAFYLRFEGKESVFIDHYALVSSLDVSGNDPYSWTLSASRDNKSWVELDRREAQRFNTRLQTREYELEHAEAYQYYLLEIESNNGGMQTSIGEWILSEGALDPTASYSTEVKDADSMLYPVGRITSEYNDSPVLEKVTKLLDNDAETDFVTGHDKFYVSWESYEEVYGNQYTLVASEGDAASAPRSWKFYSSADGSQWELQDERANQVFEPGEAKTFHCKEITDFNQKVPMHKYYKLEIEDNNGASSTRLAEWSVGYKCRGFGDIVYLATNFTHSDETPMGTEYSWWVKSG